MYTYYRDSLGLSARIGDRCTMTIKMVDLTAAGLYIFNNQLITQLQYIVGNMTKILSR